MTFLFNPDLIIECLRGVYDPELGIDVVSLGLIYGVEVEGRNVRVRMTLTTKGCPLHATMREAVKEAVRLAIPEAEVEVELVWSPPWSPDRISEQGRRELGR
jgi:metal-sulfur cluster biosynthetic enzyme